MTIEKEEKMTFRQKLVEVKTRWDELGVTKDQTAGGKKFSWDFIALPTVDEYLTPIFTDLRLSWNSRCHGDTLSVTVLDIDSDDSVSSTINLVLGDDPSGYQEIGKQITYFTRYLLLYMLALLVEKDTSESSGKNPATIHPRRGTPGAKRQRIPRAAEEDEDDFEDDEDDEEEEEEEEVAPKRRRPGGTGGGGLPMRQRRRAR